MQKGPLFQERGLLKGAGVGEKGGGGRRGLCTQQEV